MGLAAKGHQVSIVCPEGSQIPEGIEHIACKPREDEKQVWERLYRERLEKGEWDAGCVYDHSWSKWSYVSSVTRDPNLPIVGILHSVPQIYNEPPPVRWPCLVGLSEAHCQDIRLHLKCDAVRVYNGIPLDFYTPDANIVRGQRYLFIGRYCVEKGPLIAIDIARKHRIPLDLVGDTEIVGDQGYVDRCRQACDGLQIRWMPGMPRDQTVNLYRSHRATVCPTSWSEAFGLVSCESMACGTPVLALKRGANAEIIKQGVSGFVLDTVDEMEQAIREEWVSRIKPEDCRTVAEQFSVQRMVDAYEKIAQEVALGYRW